MGGRLAGGRGSAAREKLGNKIKNSKTPKKNINISFSRERGNVKQTGQVSWLGFKPTCRAFPPNQRQKDRG